MNQKQIDNTDNSKFEQLRDFPDYEILNEYQWPKIRCISTGEILDYWFNGYGEMAVEINSELYLIDELIKSNRD